MLTIDFTATLWRVQLARDPDAVLPHRRYSWTVQRRVGHGPWADVDTGTAPTQQRAYSAAWDAWTMAAGIPTDDLDDPEPVLLPEPGPRTFLGREPN